MAKRTIDWKNDGIELDPLSFSAQLKAAYGEYVTARTLASTKRAAFEAEFTKTARPKAGCEYVFGHNFGKLSVVEVPAVTKTASVKAVSMAAFAKRS
jgi:hypothetical protein